MSNPKSPRKIHVLFFTTALGGGGAEMHLLRLANHLDRSRFQVSLALSRAGGVYESKLADGISVYHLTRSNSSTRGLIQAIKPLRNLMKDKQPDVVCSMMDHANVAALLAARGLSPRPRMVACVQINPSMVSNRWRIDSQLVTFGVSTLYPGADQVVASSQGVAENLVSLWPELKGNVKCIYNAGLDETLLNLADESLPDQEVPSDGPLLVACGRLTEQKGYSYLLDAFAQVRQTKSAYLWILGDGELRADIETRIRQLNLDDSVKLLGFQSNPFKYMAAADIFVLSSIFEGFGNVVVEAMACGAPVVSTSCPYGPPEIIQDGVSGLLVPPASADALAHAIIRVLEDDTLRENLAQKGRERAQHFDATSIASAYGDMFQQLTK